MHKKLLPFLFVFVGVANGFSQFNPSIQWQRSYGKSIPFGYITGMEHTTDGGYIMVGDSGWNNSVNLAKLDGLGNVVWQSNLNSVAAFYDVRQTSNGSYITIGQDNTVYNPIVIKLDANGTLIWQQSYPTLSQLLFQTIRQTSDGGYILAGRDNDLTLPENIHILKLNASGGIVWYKTYGGSGNDGAYAIEQTTDGGYIVAGYTDSNDGDIQHNHGGLDIWVLKLFYNGDLEWERTYGGSGTDDVEGSGIAEFANDMIRQTTDGGYIVTGYTTSNDGDVSGPLKGDADVWVIKLHPNGSIAWEKNYGGSLSDTASSIIQTPGGNYIVAGSSFSSDGDINYPNQSPGISDIWIFKIDATGNFVWGTSIGSFDNDYSVDIDLVSGCEFAVAAAINIEVPIHYATLIKFHRTLSPPFSPDPQNFCWRENPVIDSLDVQGDTNLGYPVTINWYDNKNDVYALSGNTPLTDGEKYYVSQTIDGCESPMDSVVVNITPDVLPIAVSPQSFCLDESPELSDIAITGQNLLWYQDPNATVQIPPNAVLEDGKTYYASQTVDGCESSPLAIEVEVFPSPEAFPVPTIVACDTDGNGEGEFFLPDLDDAVSGGAGDVKVTYHASLPSAENGDDPLSDTHTVQTSPASIFARIMDTTTGCDNIVEVELVIAPVPEIINLEDLAGCDNGNGEALFDLAKNKGNILGNQDPQNLKITYHEISADAENGDNAIPNSENYTSTNKTIFVRLENAETGCYATGSFAIVVNPRPDINAVQLTEEFCSDEPGGSSATVDLSIYDAQINPNAPTGTEVVYYENLAAYNSGEAIENPNNYRTTEASGSTPQTIIAEVVDTTTGCSSLTYAKISIYVNDRPIVDLSSYDGMAICWDSDLSTPVEGGNYDNIILETGLNENEYNFTWTLDGMELPETSPNLEAAEPGVYTVTVTDTDGISTTCSSSSTATIMEANPPEFQLERTTEVIANGHALMVINVTGVGGFEFRLDDGTWIPLGDDGVLLFTDIVPGFHTVYGRSRDGCGTTVHSITLIGYPKFFTPNGDGHNDRWNIIGLENQQQAEIHIFDRYGKLLESLNPAAPGWDGTYNGKRMPSNDYWFRVNFMETLADGTKRPQVFKANFTLKR